MQQYHRAYATVTGLSSGCIHGHVELLAQGRCVLQRLAFPIRISKPSAQLQPLAS